MFSRLTAVLAAACMLDVGGAAADERKPDKVIEITVKDGKVTFVEQGARKAEPVTVVVGQTVRWENRDTKPHTVVSSMTADGKPVIDTDVIKPGGYKDLLLTIDVYQRAKGKPADVVTISFHLKDNPDDKGELLLLSAARR